MTTTTQTHSSGVAVLAALLVLKFPVEAKDLTATEQALLVEFTAQAAHASREVPPRPEWVELAEACARLMRSRDGREAVRLRCLAASHRRHGRKGDALKAEVEAAGADPNAAGLDALKAAEAWLKERYRLEVAPR